MTWERDPWRALVYGAGHSSSFKFFCIDRPLQIFTFNAFLYHHFIVLSCLKMFWEYLNHILSVLFLQHRSVDLSLDYYPFFLLSFFSGRRRRRGEMRFLACRVQVLLPLLFFIIWRSLRVSIFFFIVTVSRRRRKTQVINFCLLFQIFFILTVSRRRRRKTQVINTPKSSYSLFPFFFMKTIYGGHTGLVWFLYHLKGVRHYGKAQHVEVQP